MTHSEATHRPEHEKPEPTESIDPKRPEKPPTVTFNRTMVALIAGALLLGLLLIIGPVLFAGGEEASSSNAGPSSSEAAARAEATANKKPKLYEQPLPDSLREQQATVAGTDTVRINPEAPPYRQGAATPPPGMRSPYAPLQRRSRAAARGTQRTPAEQAYHAALAAQLVALGGSGSPSGSLQRPPASETASETSRPPVTQQQYVDRYMQRYGQAMRRAQQSTTGQATQKSATSGAAMPARRQVVPGRSRFQQQAAQEAGRGAYIASPVRTPISSYEIKAGTTVPAVLMTEVNSELPGSIVAMTTRPVYDFYQRHILIPAGTKLLGSYDSNVLMGQERALVAFTRMIFPDGRHVMLPGIEAKDLAGATGMKDDVDRHYGRIFGTAAAMAALGTGAALLQPDRAGTYLPGAGRRPSDVVTQQVALQVQQVAAQLIRQQMRVKPTIHIRRGYRFYLFFNRDLAFEEPYEPSPLNAPRFASPSSHAPSPGRAMRASEANPLYQRLLEMQARRRESSSSSASRTAGVHFDPQTVLTETEIQPVPPAEINGLTEFNNITNVNK